VAILIDRHFDIASQFYQRAHFAVCSLSVNMRMKAFTLVEIMVVLTIIGLLALIAFPLYSHVRQSAARGTAKSDGALLAGAAQRYYLDCGATIVPVSVLLDSSTGYIASLSAGNLVPAANMVDDPSYTFEIDNPFLQDGGLTFNYQGQVIGDPY
jgi:prepilin-type N-terminal cleavage/methylation domain-containing protein